MKTGQSKSTLQMMLTYLGIGLVVYAAIYYLFLMKKPGYQMTKTEETVTEGTAMVSVAPSTTDPVMFKTDMDKGAFLVDRSGMTLYIFDKDTKDVSNCYQTCAVNWPPYLVAGTEKVTQANLGEIKRTDGTMQYTWMGMPLYYYKTDVKVGDITGDGVGGTWHLVKQ